MINYASTYASLEYLKQWLDLETTPEKFKYFCRIKDICLYDSLGAYNISKIVIDQTAWVLLNICPKEEILDNNLVSILVPEYIAWSWINQPPVTYTLRYRIKYPRKTDKERKRECIN